MEVFILEEAGYDYALRGMAYSYRDRAIPLDEWWTPERRAKAEKRIRLLCDKENGENKVLRQIMLWIDIDAPRAFWSEFDTYKVGTVAQSESTMHTLAKRPPSGADFERGTSMDTIMRFEKEWLANKSDIAALKMNMPEGFLQRRLVTMNYAVLRNIIAKRTNHRLWCWRHFLMEIRSQVEHPELLWSA